MNRKDFFKQRSITQKFRKQTFLRVSQFFDILFILGCLFLSACVSETDRSQLTGELSVIFIEEGMNHKSGKTDGEVFFLQTKERKQPYRLNIPKKVLSTFKPSSGISVSINIANFNESLLQEDELTVKNISLVVPKRMRSRNLLSLTKTTYRKVLVVAAHLSDHRFTSYTLNHLALEETFKELNTLYDESTHGLVQFTFNPQQGFKEITLPLSKDRCELAKSNSPGTIFSEIISYVKSKLDREINSLDARHIVIVTPHDTCFAAGVGEVGQLNSSNRAFSIMPVLKDSRLSLSAIAHEIGHNLGFSHAGEDVNNDEIFGEGKGENKYSDKSSFMGYGYGSATLAMSLNAPLMLQSGFLYQYPNSVVEGHTGEFTIDALSSIGTGNEPKLIVFRKPKSERVYVLSYKPKDRPSSLKTNADYAKGVSLHTVNLGFVPSAQPTMLVKVLSDNDEYHRDGVVIKQMRVAEDHSSVRIHLTIPSTETNCVENPVSFEVSNENSVRGSGDIKTFTFLIKNQNSKECAPTTFHLLTHHEDGYEVLNSSRSLKVHPGESKILKSAIQVDDVSRSVRFELVDGDAIAPHNQTQTLCQDILVGSREVEERSLCKEQEDKVGVEEQEDKVGVEERSSGETNQYAICHQYETTDRDSVMYHHWVFCKLLVDLSTQ